MRSLLLAVAVLAAATPVAYAGIPDDDPPPSDGNPNHVHKHKPWKAKFQYRMERQAKAYAELNARSDVQAVLPKDQWYSIDCQLTNTTQNGEVLWNHVPNLGWIADHNMQTFTNGRLEGSPSCDVPGPSHVWFEQPWAATKEYRFGRGVTVRQGPAGGKTSQTRAKDSWTTIDCSTRANGAAWVRLYKQVKVGEFWVKADALRFWQQGLPAALPTCKPESKPINTWVAMGDSYAAGQGANEYDTSSGSCRRSRNAYWYLLKKRLPKDFTVEPWNFAACSGATTSTVRADQLVFLDGNTRLVTISVGGNDLHFKEVLTHCAAPTGTSCKEAIREQFTDDNLEAFAAKLDALYNEIRAKAPDAVVLVLGYPELVPRDHIDGCGAMDDTDAPYLHRAATRVNGTIAAAVGRHTGFRFVGLVRAFLGHSACNDDATDWINGLVPSDKQESFHPNAAGHLVIAGRLRAAAPRFFK
jgi:lysophospholipase L1-like esterase